MDELIDVCVGQMANEDFSEEQARAYLQQLLPTLDYWKRYEELSDDGQFDAFKQKVIEEINQLAIVNAMVGIERAYPDTLDGLFSSFDDANWTDKSKLSDARLKDLVEHMSSLKVGNQDYSADVTDDAYEFLIKKFADLSKKNAGEFYTPRSVVKLMVEILDPKAGETVYENCTTSLIRVAAA